MTTPSHALQSVTDEVLDVVQVDLFMDFEADFHRVTLLRAQDMLSH